MSSPTVEPLTCLVPGMAIPFGGDRITRVSPELAEAFQPGDRLIVLQESGDLLHIPRAEWEIAAAAVERAHAAFRALEAVSDDRITRFFARFAARLADDAVWERIAAANAADVARARERGRSTTRLVADEKMRRAMIAGLHDWEAAPSQRGRVVETIEHCGWRVEVVTSGLGVVGFVFEARPNVLADGTGVLRSGNTAVMRIGGDALGTAQAIVTHALRPALVEAGLPGDAVTLVESTARSAGWALFANPKLALAVARGSGPAVAQLGAVARQAGVPVSLHGKGGAWIVADTTADAEKFRAVVFHSIDRWVCNTCQTVCIPRSRANDLVPALLSALRARAECRGSTFRLHVAAGDEACVPPELFRTQVTVRRAAGERTEPIADIVPPDALGTEREWEDAPEVTLKLVTDWEEAARLFNAQSPRFVASLVSEDPVAWAQFFARIDAPFVGNGFTRWVDGQYALHRPELGLSNWQNGRLFGRSAILTGDGVYTLRMRMTQSDFTLHR